MISAFFVGRLDESAAPAPDAATGVVRAADLGEALRLLRDPRRAPPQLVLLAQSRSGQVSPASLAALRKLAPLVRVWRLLGSWCEGEARSGHPPPGCLSAYWHQWEARCARELETARRGKNPGWTLPLTATAEERLLADDGVFAPPRRGTIAICTATAEAGSALADLCRTAGYDAVVAAEDGRFRLAGVSAVLWDTTPLHLANEDRVRTLRTSAGGAPVLAIVGFPRHADVARARAAGIAAVVAKPFLAADLLWHLDRLCDEVPVAPAAPAG